MTPSYNCGEMTTQMSEAIVEEGAAMPEQMEDRADARPVTLDELIALNDEIAALTREGVPLERGLVAFSGDLPRRLELWPPFLGERMSRGETLSEALRRPRVRGPHGLPRVVEAGLRR